MSSTNRSKARYDHKNDFYVTPISQVELFLKEFMKVEPLEKEMKILDPCAGGDEHHPMSYPVALEQAGFTNIRTVDIRGNSRADEQMDYLETSLHEKYPLIISNPPFMIADQFIKKGLEDCEESGFVVMLLRLNFLGGVARKNGLWDTLGQPKWIFVHHKRMSFTPDGKTDSIEYAHFVWQKGYVPASSNLVII